jgi:hypothetical protein
VVKNVSRKNSALYMFQELPLVENTLYCDPAAPQAVKNYVTGVFNALPPLMGSGVEAAHSWLGLEEREEAVEATHICDGLLVTPMTDRVRKNAAKVVFGAL